MTRASRIALLSGVVASGAVTGLVSVGWGAAPWWAFVAMTATIVFTEVADIRLVVGKQVWAFSLTETFLGAALILAPGGWLAVSVAVAVAGVMAQRRGGSLKVAFNGAQFALATIGGVAICHSLGDGVNGASVGVLSFSVINFLLVAVAISTASGWNLRRMINASAAVEVFHSLGNASVGLLGGWLAVHAPFGLIALAVPLYLLWLSYRQQARQSAEAHMFAELAQGQERVAGPSTDTSARVVVAAANRVLEGTSELLVLTDEPVHYRDIDGSVSFQRADSNSLSLGWVLEALGSAGLAVGRDGNAPYLVARLGGPDRPLAVLRVVRPANAPVFERRDEMMASILIGQAESWFAMVELTEARDEAVARAEMSDAASRVIGDMGAETFPALQRLRESAVRLTRLANTATSRDGVGDIVEELHAAERAVASLLGAIAMAADTQLAADDVIELPAGSSMGDDDWTTTGTLDLEAADGAS
ncbi:MAG: hypothetical protein JWM93_3704 [Frankiales bacterium]|nr:hypothetical protein [Frankiales bacterium]